MLACSIHSAQKSAQMRGERNNDGGHQFKAEARNGNCLLMLALPAAHHRGNTNQRSRRTPEDQVQQQYSLEFLSCKLKLPRQNASHYDRHSENRSGKYVDARRSHHRGPIHPLLRESGREVEAGSEQEQGNGEVNQHYMLSMLCQQSRSQIKRVAHSTTSLPVIFG